MFQGISSQMWAIAFFVFMVLAFQRRQAFISLLKFRLRLGTPERVERSVVPQEIAVLLDGARPQLEALGFRYEYTDAVAPLSAFDPRPLRFADVYWHPQHAVHAQVRLGEPYAGQAVSLDFITVFADGIKLETTNRRLWAVMAPDLEGYVFEDAYADTLDAHWQAHLHALARESASHGQPLEFAAADAALADDLRQMFRHLQARGWLAEEAPGVYRFTLKGAWLYARRQLRELAKVKKLLKRPFQHGYAPDLQALRAHEMAGFAASIEMGAQPLPRWMKIALFALTLAVSVLLFGRQFSFGTAAALLLVLFVHEAGHLLAMRAFGFRNLSMVFLPYFGAVASGHKTHVKPWQETVILLAGPLPGLIAVLFLSQMPLDGLSDWAAAFWRTVFWFSLLINLFNLLPVGILDGGKLFKLAVLSRFPWVGAFFWTAGTLVALVYSLANGLIVLALAMGLLLMSVRNQFRAARAISAIRKQARAEGKDDLEKEEVVARLGHHLARPEFNEATVQGWAKRNAVAIMAYPRLLQGVLPLSSSAGVLAAHAAAFFAPLLIAAWLVQQPVKPPLLRQVPYAQTEAGKAALARWKRDVAAARAKFMARYAATSGAEQKWSMLEETDDDEGETGLDPTWVMQQYRALQPRLPADHPGRLEPLIDAAEKKAGPQAQAALLKVIAMLGNGDGRKIAALDDGRYNTLADAWDALARRGQPAALAAQDRLLEAVWVCLQQPGTQGGEGDGDWRSERLAATAARLAYGAGHAPRAEEWMARRAATLRGGRRYTVVAQGWLMLDAGEPEQALALAGEALAAPSLPVYWRVEWMSVAGWAEMSRHDPRAADAWFTRAIHEPDAASQKDAGPFNVATWLIGVIYGAPRPTAPQITGAMLEHLAALQQYDAQEAARYRATLTGLMTEKWRKNIAPRLIGTLYTHGWGRLRADTLGKMLDITPVNGGAAN